MIEPLPKQIASLIAAERATTASTAVREAVREKLALSIGSAPLGAAAATSVIKIVTIVALAIGTGTIAVIKSPRSTPSPMSAAPIAHVEPWELAQDPVDAPIAPHVESWPAPLVPAVTSVASAPAAKPQLVMGEPDMIAAAWAALSDRDPARALELAKRDAREHAHGVLAEECAAITIVALVRLDRFPEATAAADRFKQEYPNSIHGELVTNALAGDTP